MEISNFASKVEEAYKIGKNKSGSDEAVKYMQEVVRKAENIERESKGEKTAQILNKNKVIRDNVDYEK